MQVPDNLIGQLEVGDCDEDLLCDEYKDFVHTAWVSAASCSYLCIVVRVLCCWLFLAICNPVSKRYVLLLRYVFVSSTCDGTDG